MSSTTFHAITVKVSNGPDVRRFTVPSTELPNFNNLSESCAALFGHPSAQLLWRDPDGDMITIGGEADLQEALAVLREVAQTVLRLEIVPTPELPAPHPNTSNDNGKSGRGRETPFDRKAARLAEFLECDIDSAKEMIRKAKAGDDEVRLSCHIAKASLMIENKVQWLAEMLGSDVEHAKDTLHKALDGDKDAIAVLCKLKQKKHDAKAHWHNMMGYGKGCGKGEGNIEGCGFGKGKGFGKGHGKGEGKSGKGHCRGRPLVRALVRLAGMKHPEAAEAIDGAQAGDESAQMKISAALEAINLSGTSSETSSSDSSTTSDSDSADDSCGKRKMVALKMLRFLANGDLETFTEKKKSLMEKLHSQGSHGPHRHSRHHSYHHGHHGRGHHHAHGCGHW